MILGKTQSEIEHEYAWIDLPELLRISGERRAKELIENIRVSSFPHYSENETREAIMKELQARLPQTPKAPTKTAEEQYQAQLARMKAGG